MYSSFSLLANTRVSIREMPMHLQEELEHRARFDEGRHQEFQRGQALDPFPKVGHDDLEYILLNHGKSRNGGRLGQSVIPTAKICDCTDTLQRQTSCCIAGMRHLKTNTTDSDDYGSVIAPAANKAYRPSNPSTCILLSLLCRFAGSQILCIRMCVCVCVCVCMCPECMHACMHECVRMCPVCMSGYACACACARMYVCLHA